MKSTWIVAACALLMIGTAADAQKRPRHRTTHRVVRKKSSARSSPAENSLVGIRLFDSGVRVVTVYGTPDDIEAVTIGGGAVGSGGGGPAGGPSGGGRERGGGRSGAPPGLTDVQVPTVGSSEFDGMGNAVLRQAMGGPLTPPPSDSPGGSGPGGGPGGGGGAGGGGGENSERVTMTRWIYNRGGSKYGFIVDKFNRVIQIEAIGLQNAKVRTRAGIGFGATFARIMRTYGTPDGYEIGGNTIVVRFLSRRHVAFRLNRLGENKPHVVTGVVVAAGK